MSELKAYWSISLDWTCPDCDHLNDLIEDDPEFFGTGRGGMEPIEHGTDRSKNYEVYCGNCEREFEVDFEY